MSYWNASVHNIEPETLKVVKDMMYDMKGMSADELIAKCGCEVHSDGNIHLCNYHMGYDCAVEVMKAHYQAMSAAREALGKEMRSDGQGKWQGKEEA